jgi:HSP20 family protein
MAIMRWDPFTALSRMDTEFDDLVRRTWGSSQTAGFVPAVDMVRDGEDVVITLELPGVDIDNDVDIEVAPRRLTIAGSRSSESESSQGRVMVREMRAGSFRREFALPEHVSADDVEAAYDKGLLTVRVHNVSRPEPAATKVAVASSSAPSTPQVESAKEPEAPTHDEA